MTDERFVYNADLRDRKRTAYGARAKKGGSRSKSCTLPSDALSASQKRKLNGSVESISLNSPMSWARLRELTPTLQFLYLDHLVTEHKARRVDLCAMLGVATCTFWKLQQKLPGKLLFNGNPKKPAPEWEAFMAEGYQDTPQRRLRPHRSPIRRRSRPRWCPRPPCWQEASQRVVRPLLCSMFCSA